MKPVEKTLIELDEKQLLLVLAEAYNLTPLTTKISISHSEGDQREPGYTKVTITGEKFSMK